MSRGTYIRTEECNEAHKGKHWKLSEKRKQEMSKTNKRLGIKPPSRLGKLHSEETKRKISLSNKGRHWKLSEEAKKHIGEAKIGNKNCLGRHYSEETKRKMSIAQKGDKSYSWKGGITPINELIRGSAEFENWRKAIFERDNYTCQLCGDSKGGNLEAHHIEKFANYPEKRFNINNGMTLCKNCHHLVHKSAFIWI